MDNLILKKGKISKFNYKEWRTINLVTTMLKKGCYQLVVII
jgi:hypothetical protein